MKQNKCAVCGATKKLEHHHIIPKADGGTDDETNLLTLCSKHHAAIHGMKLTRERKSWGSPNRNMKGQYSCQYRKRFLGKFIKEEKTRVKKLVCLHEHEWELIDKAKREYKCGRGGFISMLLDEYITRESN